MVPNVKKFVPKHTNFTLIQHRKVPKYKTIIFQINYYNQITLLTNNICINNSYFFKVVHKIYHPQYQPGTQHLLKISLKQND